MDDMAVQDRVVSVPLKDEAYDIHIGLGLLDRAGAVLRPRFRRPFTVVIGDEAVMARHFPTLEASLRSSGFTVQALSVPAGEGSKSFAQIERLCGGLLDVHIERGDHIIALGGGVIGDLAGFAASIVLRGVGIVQCPTTLLAQVDSSVGGKTGINMALGKNLVGTFHQPAMVLCDVGVLSTLPVRDLRSGYAEIVKYALLGDKNFLIWLESNYESVLGSAGAARIYAIEKSCRAKSDIVCRDVYEGGVRSLLNLGHTFGHALEAVAGYGDALRHGEAVSIGIVLAFHLSVRLGLCPAADAERVRGHLHRVGLPTSVHDPAITLPDAETLFAFMRRDKKAVDGRVRFILPDGIGRASIRDDIEPSVVIEFLKDSLSV